MLDIKDYNDLLNRSRKQHCESPAQNEKYLIDSNIILRYRNPPQTVKAAIIIEAIVILTLVHLRISIYRKFVIDKQRAKTTN